MIDQSNTDEQLPAGVGADVSPDQSVAPAPGQQPPAQPESPWGGADFNSQNYKLDYRGQVKYPTDAAHAKNLMQQGLSYSQSMEELGTRNKALDTREQEMEGKYGRYAEFDQRLKNNPAEYSKFESYFNGTADQGQQPTGQTFNPVYDEKVKGLETQIQSLLEANEDRTLQTGMDKLKQQHANYDWDSDNGDGKLGIRIMQHAQNMGLNENQIELAFLDYHKDQLLQQNRVAGAAQVSDKIQAQSKAGIQQGPPSSTPTQQPPAQDVSKMTVQQANAAAKKELGLV